MDDGELVERVRNGDQAAFGVLVERHQTAVYRATLAALGSPPDAEEAAQDAFLAAHRHLHRFRGDSAFRTWLLAIAWRQALSLRRRRVWRVGRQSEPLPLSAASGTTPEEDLQGIRLRTDLRRLVRALPRRLRDPLLLMGTGEYSYAEVAQMLRAPEGTIKSRVFDARRMLKERLASLGYEVKLKR
ncbi:MAG: RNA polymerase sigma factor [Acidobacteriota bacterium]|nr:RNA polymerase sigma factor [Acidobacteriota bacterium]